MLRLRTLLLALFVMASATAFTMPPTTTTTRAAPTTQTTTTTALQEGRRWNFNEGQAPWGMKKNAEIWNGRVAQVGCWLWILLG